MYNSFNCIVILSFSVTVIAGLARIRLLQFQLHSQEIVDFLYRMCAVSSPVNKNVSATAVTHNVEQWQARGDPLIPFHQLLSRMIYYQLLTTLRRLFIFE